MSWVVAARLAGIFAVIAVGWLAARTRTLGGPEVVAALSTSAFVIFTPALLFRTTARIDLAALPPLTLAAFFGPAVVLLLAVYGWHRWRHRSAGPDPRPVAAPAVRAISTSFGNTVQLGIPVAAAVFGESALPLHVAIVSLHALVLLTVVTALVETDLSRSGARPDGGPAAALAQTVRRTVVHPVVTPVLVGLAWNLAGLPLPGPVDGVLIMLGQAVVPVSLVVIGMSLRHFGIAGRLRPALEVSAVKLLAQPGLVFVAAHWGAGLRGVPLGVVVMCAGLPTGSNALLFAQRYRTSEGETTAGIVVSMLGFVVTAPLWLLTLGLIAP